MEFRRKRLVMMAMDLTRFAALMSVPAAFALGWLSFAQLLVVWVITGAAKIAFGAASGAYLKTLVRPGGPARRERAVRVHHLDRHRGRAAQPLGGAAVGLFGPVATMLADAVSYLLSAAGICAIGEQEPRRYDSALVCARPASAAYQGLRHADLYEEAVYILTRRRCARCSSMCSRSTA